MNSYRRSHVDRGSSYDDVIAADAWDSYMHQWEKRHLEEIVPAIFGGKAPRCLDFACGTGRITSVLAPLVDEVVGVDISESMLEAARAKLPGVRFVHGDLTRDPIDLGKFDLVTSFRFFGNSEASLRSSVLATLNQRQPVGGHLIVNNHRNPNSLSALAARITGAASELDLTHHRFRRLLHAGGYAIVEARPIGVWQFRAKLMQGAGTNPRREARLERLFRAGALSPIAPDTVIVAKKARDVAAAT